MAHCLLGAPLVVIDSNGALWTRCAISMYGKMEKKIIHTSGAPCLRCAISVFHTNGVSQTGAPLVYSSGALLPRCAIRINPIYSPFPSSVGLWSDGATRLRLRLMGRDIPPHRLSRIQLLAAD